MITQNTTLPPLPEPAMKASEGVCCGNYSGGAYYMGQQETICCGQPDEAWPDYFTTDQMHAYARAAIAAQAPQPLPKDASGWNGSFEQAWRMGHYTRSKELTDDVRAQIEREVRAQQAQGVPAGFKLVPVEPTPEMLACLPTIRGESVEREIWANLLAAAPQAEPQPEPKKQDAPLLRQFLAAAKEAGITHLPQLTQADPIPGEAIEQAFDALIFGSEPQPKREPLTDEQIKTLYHSSHWWELGNYPFTWGAASVVVRAIEAAHGIGTKPDQLQFVQLPDGDWDIVATGTKGGDKP